jgi:hypothetical protein
MKGLKDTTGIKDVKELRTMEVSESEMKFLHDMKGF